MGASLASLYGFALMPTEGVGAKPDGVSHWRRSSRQRPHQFGVQAGVTVSFDTEQARNLTTAGLEGSYSIEEGLDLRLLANKRLAS